MLRYVTVLGAFCKRPLDYSPIPAYFSIMEVFGLRRTVLCVYECLRLAFLVGVFMLLQPEGTVSFPWLALITPGAMFLLMALFWRINLDRYRIYGPLYLAGKALSVITTVFWLFFTQRYMISALILSGAALLIVPGIVFYLMIGDVLSVWLVMVMIQSKNGGGR